MQFRERERERERERQGERGGGGVKTANSPDRRLPLPGFVLEATTGLQL